MNTAFSKTAAIATALFAMVCASGSSFAADNTPKGDTFYQGKKGEALKALEKTAGKKAQDVKVPEVPKPTRVP